ncbi:unnamed protein product [Haemonchus placei]|uniref:DNA gyrase subunit A n=1 Tax=Haemonchus placei TaxID=6290 RepID=A0A0N4W9V6_HAEPC|nr:unnamed protein product [Haemonchus placei]
MTVTYLSSVDRAYKRYACNDYDNIVYLHHPSGVSVVVLKKQPKTEVVEVDFGSVKKNGTSRMDNVVIGKGKKGGLHLQKDTRLCTIRCKDGEEIVVRAGVKGVLAEVSHYEGYIAVITYGAGKRTPDEFVTELSPKKVLLENYEESTPETELN